jgi:16S rRNA (guanine966-N2)-methyltransferase
MRIIAGKYRGKKLFSPDTKDVRPTSDRARESIFNILNSRFSSDYSKYNLLDIYAGTGAFGFEALSRGFASVTFIDKNTENIQKNAKLFPNEQAKINILKADATNLPKINKTFDLVFMDAPYSLGLTEKTLLQLVQKNWLSDNVLCIVETQKNEEFALHKSLEIIDERIYGIAKISFICKKQ